MTYILALKSILPRGLFFIAAFVLLFAFAGVYSFAIPGLLFLYLVYSRFGDDFLLFSSLFLLLGFSGDVGDELRTLLNFIAFGFSGWLMLKSHLKSEWKHISFPIVLTVFFLIILLSMVISAVVSGYISVGAAHTVRQFMFFVLLYFIYNLLIDIRGIQKLIDFVIIVAAYVALTIIYSFFSNITSIEKLITEVMVKEGGLFSNVAGPGALISVALIAMNYRILSGRGIVLTQKYTNIIITILLVLGLLLTNSRGAILCAAAGSIAFQFLLNRKGLVRFLIWGVALLLVLFIIFSGFFDVFNLFFRTERVLENTRYVLWELTWNMIEKNFIFGTGPGVPKLTWTQYTNVMFNTWTGDQVMWVFEKGGLGHSHNFLLFRWAELGLLGLFTTLWLYVYFPFRGFSLFKKSFRENNTEIYLLSGLALSIIAGIFVRSVFEATGILSHGWISRDLPFWLFILILLSGGGLLQKEDEKTEKGAVQSGF